MRQSLDWVISPSKFRRGWERLVGLEAAVEFVVEFAVEFVVEFVVEEPSCQLRPATRTARRSPMVAVGVVSAGCLAESVGAESAGCLAESVAVIRRVVGLAAGLRAASAEHPAVQTQIGAPGWLVVGR